MRSSRKKRPGAWIGIVLASSFLLVGAMKMGKGKQGDSRISV